MYCKIKCNHNFKSIYLSFSRKKYLSILTKDYKMVQYINFFLFFQRRYLFLFFFINL